MKKEELYVGMRVYNDAGCAHGVPGTIIDVRCLAGDYDCLVEFDRHVDGHSGLGWGTVEGREGCCFWTYARFLEEIPNETVQDCDFTYDDFIKGIFDDKNTV